VEVQGADQGDSRELLNGGNDAKRVPRGVGVNPQRLLRVIRAVLEQPGAERERPRVPA